MLVLGIETSTAQVGVAIGGHEGVLAQAHSSRGKRHGSERLSIDTPSGKSDASGGRHGFMLPWAKCALAGRRPTAFNSALALFAFGWTFAAHILPALTKRAPKRATGIWTMVFIGLMVASGYLMQVSTGDAARKAFAIAHWISSGLFVAGYVAHLIPLGRANAR